MAIGAWVLIVLGCIVLAMGAAAAGIGAPNVVQLGLGAVILTVGVVMLDRSRKSKVT